MLGFPGQQPVDGAQMLGPEGVIDDETGLCLDHGLYVFDDGRVSLGRCRSFVLFHGWLHRPRFLKLPRGSVLALIVVVIGSPGLELGPGFQPAPVGFSERLVSGHAEV